MKNNPSESEIFVLGIDPSSSVTGVALVRAGLHTPPSLVGSAAIASKQKHVNPSTALSLRIREITRTMELWLPAFPAADIVGYEKPFFSPRTTNAATDGLLMACGAYLSCPLLHDLPQYPIPAVSAKAVYNGAKLKREQAKPAAIKWAVSEFRIPTQSAAEMEAIADALAVAVATWGKWKEEKQAECQRPLFGPGSGKKRTKEAIHA